MKNLGSHIAQILAYNGTATLPGIGTFKPVHISARFDKELNRFIPPTLTVHFDPALPEDDISGSDGLPEGITQLREELEKQGTVSIEGIGTLTKEASELRFVPVREDFYAFTPLSERSDIFDISAEALAVPDSADQPENASTIIEENLIEEETDKKNSWLKWAAVLLIGGIAIYGYYWYSENAGNVQSSNPLPEVVSTNAVMDSTINTNEVDTGVISTIDSTREPTFSTNAPEGDFEVIIASFRKIEEAEAYVHTMKNKGYELRIIAPNRAGNLHKISCGAYRTKDEALIELRKVRRNLVAGAWLFEHATN